MVLKQIKYTILVLFLIEFLAFLSSFIYSQPTRVYQYSYLTGYQYDPYVGFSSPRFPFYGDVDKVTNNTIVITGGSTAAGIGVTNPDKSYFKVLEKNLKQKKIISDHEIINYAVPGFVSTQEAFTYKYNIFNLKKAPRALLSFTSFNDIYFYLFREMPLDFHEFSYSMDVLYKHGYPSPESSVEKLKNKVRESYTFGVVAKALKLAADGKYITLSSSFFDPYQPKPEEHSNEFIQAVVDNFVQNSLQTALLAKEKGTRYILVIQPNYYYGGQLTVENNEWFPKMEELNRWISEVGADKTSYDKFYNLVKLQLADMQKNGLVYLLDYRELLKDSGPVYLDPVHYNEYGSELVAKQLEKDLIKILDSKK